MDNDNFPAECRACYANCYTCIKENHGHRLSEIRQLVAKRKLKIQAVTRLTREIAMIDEQLEHAIRTKKTGGKAYEFV